MGESPRIYLSSTFDLDVERNEVKKYLQDANCVCITTNQATSNDNICRFCEYDIDTCDVFLLLLGPRYGTLVLRENAEEISFTHHEYRYAKKKGKQIIAIQINKPGYEKVSSAEVARREKFWEEIGSILNGGVYFADVAKEVLAKITRLALNSGLLDSCVTSNLSDQIGSQNSIKLSSIPKNIYLMVQVAPTGDQSPVGPYYNLIPEIDLPGAQENFIDHSLSLNPENHVLLDCSLEPLAKDKTLSSCLEKWLNTVGKFAEELGRKDGGMPPLVVLEVFLPSDQLCFDLNSLKLASSSGVPRPIGDQINFITRSLDRACKQAFSIPSLNDKWQARSNDTSKNAKILLWSMGYSSEHLSRSNPSTCWLDDIYEVAKHPHTVAFVYLANLPVDSDLRKALLNTIVDVHVPVVLFWVPPDSSEPSPFSERLDMLAKLLSLPEFAFVNWNVWEESRFVEQQATFSELCVSGLAKKRRSLHAERHPAAPRSVLLVDVPDRWPKRITNVRHSPADRLQPDF